MAILGHHVGMNSGLKSELWTDLDGRDLAANHPLGLRLSEQDVKVLLRRFGDDGLVLPEMAG